jgi:exopolyphosphatase/guanosine-5'-triphosphate,3'-diphosphate pyrophosphatase
MLFASIDIGSNAARLLFANAYLKDGRINLDKASLIRIPTRLGEDVYKTQLISKEKIKDFVKTMKAFKLLIDVYRPEGYLACATAALREAKNSEEIVKKVKDSTGIKIQILNGDEEAEIIRNTNRLILPSPKPYTIFIDVGGGSTEISIEKNGELLKLHSFDVGTLRLLSDRVDSGIWKQITDWLDEFKPHFRKFYFVGTGGNINRLCKLYGEDEVMELTTGKLDYAFKQLSGLSLEERIYQFGFRPDRADVIVPAAFIYLFIMNYMEASSIFVPRKGLSDGLIIKQYSELQSSKLLKII